MRRREKEEIEEKGEDIKESSQECSSGVTRETGLIGSTEDRLIFAGINLKTVPIVEILSPTMFIFSNSRAKSMRVRSGLAWDFPETLERGRSRQLRMYGWILQSKQSKEGKEDNGKGK